MKQRSASHRFTSKGPNGRPLCRWCGVGKKAAGRLLDGEEWSQWPGASL